MKVLLLMSQSQNYQRIFERLVFEGYEIFQADSTEDAYSKVLEEQIQVVVIDYEKSSDEFVRMLRRLDKTDYIYVFFLLSKNQIILQNEGTETNADEYLVKPVEPDELVARLVVVDRYSQTLTEIRSRHENSDPIRDPITGAFSKSTLLELINTEISRCKRFKKTFILANLKLDDAVYIQETFGQDILHKAMSQVGLKIWATVRAYDLISCWSNFEFMLLLPETTLSGAVVVAERLQKNIGSVPLRLPDSRQLILSASVALVQYSQKEFSTREELVAEVENRLKKMSHSDGNKTVYLRN